MKLPQGTISIAVACYDEAERRKLSRFPTAHAIAQLDGSEIEVPTTEFLTHYILRRKRAGVPGFRDYRELGLRIETSLRDLEGMIAFDGSSIRMGEGSDELDPHVTERVGEAIGLSVVNRIHGLTEADWGRVPSRGGARARPSLDFEVGSDGHHLVQVETKGSYVPRNDLKASTVSNHKASILGKKAALASDAQSADASKVLRYGTITVIGDGTHPLRCWLLDPPPEGVGLVPGRARVLSRIAFLRDWIAFVSPRSSLAVALANRLSDLQAISDPWELDGLPLRRADGEMLSFASTYGPVERSTFFAGKSVVTDGPHGGVMIQGYGPRLFFVGIRDALVQLALEQRFSEITSYRAEVGVIRKRIECRVSEQRFRGMRLPERIRQAAERIGQHLRFYLYSDLHFDVTGLVFGELDLETNDRA